MANGGKRKLGKPIAATEQLRWGSTACDIFADMATDWSGQRVVIMGLGRFGGGVGVTRFLVQRGASVLVTDMASPDALAEPMRQLVDLDFETRFGEHHTADFTSANTVVVNPAVNPHRNRYVRAAREAGAAITSEIRLLVEHLPEGLRRNVIGVTGTAGKSTTTAMVGHILRQRRMVDGGWWMEEGGAPKANNDLGQALARDTVFLTSDQPANEADGQSTISDTENLTPDTPYPIPDTRHPIPQPRIWLGGNLGGSLLPCLDQITKDDIAVLELSSFMLEHLADAKWSPGIAVITSFSPNHLDWHGSLEAYRQAKQAILDYQKPGDTAVLGPDVSDWRVVEGVNRIATDQAFAGTLQVPGDHNRLNAALAVNASEAVGVNGLDALQAVASFPGLAHRLEWVGDVNGARCFNDSKSTTPWAAMLALDSFDPGRVHLILGGYDKGSDLTELAQYAAQRAKTIYTIGETGPAIADAAETNADHASRDPHRASIYRCDGLEPAVQTALAQLQQGDALVLSPGCASWDQFTNYDQRGDTFRRLVQ